MRVGWELMEVDGVACSGIYGPGPWLTLSASLVHRKRWDGKTVCTILWWRWTLMQPMRVTCTPQ